VSARFIPKESLTAWQRWELASFEGAEGVAPATLPTAGELEMIRKLAEDEGYRCGLETAHAEGARLRALADALQAALAGFEQHVADQLVDLALDVAQQIVRTAIKVKPELLRAAVSDALKSLGEVHAGATLYMNAADLALWRAHAAGEAATTNVRTVEDPAIAPGGCRIVTERAEVNATLESRWRRTVEVLGRDRGWLDD